MAQILVLLCVNSTGKKKVQRFNSAVSLLSKLKFNSKIQRIKSFLHSVEHFIIEEAKFVRLLLSHQSN